MKTISKSLNLFQRKASNYILGNHPNNTIFSFNYHNVSHLVDFLSRKAASLGGSNTSVLVDIGAGRSPYYEVFKPKVARYISLDRQECLPTHETREIKQVVGIAEEIPLDSASVDIALCNQVLEHVSDPLKTVDEIYRILKPGGKFIGSVPHVSPVHLEPYDFRRYTDLGLRQLLESSGFVNSEIEGNGGVYSAAALMIAMDWMLTAREDGKPQGFSQSRALWLSPLVGFLNLSGTLLDNLLKDKKRTPANLCWIAYKPINL